MSDWIKIGSNNPARLPTKRDIMAAEDILFEPDVGYCSLKGKKTVRRTLRNKVGTDLTDIVSIAAYC